MRNLHDAGVLLQSEVGAGSSLDGVSVGAVPWPSETTLVSIERDRRLVVPKGDVRLMEGDRLTVLATDQSEHAARTVMGGAAALVGGGAIPE